MYLAIHVMKNIMCQGCSTLRIQSLKWQDRRCLLWDQQCRTGWPWQQSGVRNDDGAHWDADESLRSQGSPVPAGSLSKPLYIQVWARVRSQLWIGQTQFILVLLFINYCILHLHYNCKHTFVQSCMWTHFSINTTSGGYYYYSYYYPLFTEEEVAQGVRNSTTPLSLVTQLAEGQTGPQALALSLRLPVMWHCAPAVLFTLF